MSIEFGSYEFANWYSKLKHLVPKTRILYAPEEFREYLLADGIALYEKSDSDSDSEWESADVPPKTANDDDSDEPGSLVKPPEGFHLEIEDAISSLNGEVAPKLNWSAPVDAKWINPGNTMRCTSANEIYMLLKSSDYINHDLQLNPKTLTLILREWFDVHPSSEFRCFVRNKMLIAVTQRDMNYYEFLDAAKEQIKQLCGNTASKICENFNDDSFVFDVYIPSSWKKAWLVDVNPWNSKTDTLLFTWDELPNISELEIRLVEKVDRSRTFSSKPHSSSHVPYDFVDMEKGTLEDMLTQMKEQRKNDMKH